MLLHARLVLVQQEWKQDAEMSSAYRNCLVYYMKHTARTLERAFTGLRNVTADPAACACTSGSSAPGSSTRTVAL